MPLGSVLELAFGPSVSRCKALILNCSVRRLTLVCRCWVSVFSFSFFVLFFLFSFFWGGLKQIYKKGRCHPLRLQLPAPAARVLPLRSRILNRMIIAII